MATKKKAKKTTEKTTALVRRERAPSTLVAPRTAFEKQMNTELAEIKHAVLQLAEKVAGGGGQYAAPPPLFTYAIDVDHLRHHNVLLVSVEIQNNNVVELSLDSKCVVAVDGVVLPEMPPEYADEVELEDVTWVRRDAKVGGAQIASFAWAFEAPANCRGKIAQIGLRVGGQGCQEECEIQGFDPARQPTLRKPPKLLTGGVVAPKVTLTPDQQKQAAANPGLDQVGGAPAQLASSPWRTDDEPSPT